MPLFAYFPVVLAAVLLRSSCWGGIWCCVKYLNYCLQHSTISHSVMPSNFCMAMTLPHEALALQGICTQCANKSVCAQRAVGLAR
jgi:hypothetical protein